MASNNSHELHFAMFPFGALGHMIPLIDSGIMLAQHGVKITIFITASNAARFESALDRAKESGLLIQTVHYPFPCTEAGLPEGCENFDMINNISELRTFMKASNMCQDIVEKIFQELCPTPDCIISDVCLPYTAKIAKKFGIPRILFQVLGCFSEYCMIKARVTKTFQDKTSETMDVTVPGCADRVEILKKHIPFHNPPVGSLNHEILDEDFASYGALVNTFEELEPAYVEECRKARNGKVWCIGPVSLGTTEYYNKTDRGSRASIDGQECLNWLDSKEPSSVLYVCLGSFSTLPVEHLIELGLGLEASNRPFIWVISKRTWFQELIKWTSESGFEERIKGRGLIIKGWAPQVMILSHPSTGGFFVHCGWGSTLEAICSGLPLICFPTSADNFAVQKFVHEIARIGINLGVTDKCSYGIIEGERKIVKKEKLLSAIDDLFEGEESVKRRERVKELQKFANKALKKDESSFKGLKSFIDDIMQLKYSVK